MELRQKFFPMAVMTSVARGIARHSTRRAVPSTDTHRNHRGRMFAMTSTMATGAVRVGPAPARVSRKGGAMPAVRASASRGAIRAPGAASVAVRAQKTTMMGQRVVSARCVHDRNPRAHDRTSIARLARRVIRPRASSARCIASAFDSLTHTRETDDLAPPSPAAAPPPLPRPARSP